MKIVNLSQPTTVNGALRYPVEGSLTVSDGEAQRLKDNNLLVDEDADVAPEGSVPGGGVDGSGEQEPADDLDSKNLEQLGIIVTKEGVALHGDTKKADIIARIRAHRSTLAS